MIKKTSRWLLVTFIGLSVLVALAVIVTRIALPKVSQFEPFISEYLSQQLNAEINIESIEASWSSSNPSFNISNVRIVDRDNSSRLFKIDQIYGQFNILDSVKSFQPIFEQLTIKGLRVNVEQEQERWLTVFSPQVAAKKDTPDKEKPKGKNKALNNFLSVLAKQSHVKFVDAYLVLKPQDLPARTVGPMQLLMNNSVDMHQLSGSAQLKNYGDQSTVSFAIQADELSDVIIETPYQVYAKFENITEQFFAFNVINTGVGIKQLALDSEIWATLENGLLSGISGSLAINSLKFEEAGFPELVNSDLRFKAVRESGKQHFLLADVTLSDGDHHLKIPHANASYNFAKGHIERLAIASLNFNDLKNAFLDKALKNTALQKELAVLNVQGVMDNLVLSWRNQKLSEFELQADLKDVSVDSYKGAPALSGVTGLLKMTANNGSVDLDSQGFSAYFPALFDKRWQYKKAQGKVLWKIRKHLNKVKEVSVNSHLITLESGEERIQGRFSLALPKGKIKPSELVLMIGGNQLGLKSALSYIPNNVVDSELKKWIEKASIDGKVDQAAVVVRTPLKRVAGVLNPSVQLDFKLHDAVVNFSNDWPNYLADDLRVSIADGEISAVSKRGSLAYNQVRQLEVRKPLDQSQLLIQGGISGDLKKFVGKIKTKKVYSNVAQALKNLAFAGTHQSHLNLTIPLSNEAASAKNKTKESSVYYRVKTTLKDAQLIDENVALALKKINGKLEFDSNKGLKAKSLKAEFLSQKANIQIASEPVAKDVKTSISMSGLASAKSLAKWLESDYLEQISGQVKYSSRLDFCVNNTKCNQLVINSDLLGIAIDLPKPWGKSKEQKAKLQVVQTLAGNGDAIWRYNYKDVVRGVTQIGSATGDKKRRLFTEISLGGQRPKLPSKEGVNVSGVLSGIDLDKVFAQYSTGSRAKTATDSDSLANPLNTISHIDLKLNQVTLLGKKLKSGWINIQPSTKHWFAQFDLGIAAGQVSYAKAKGGISDVRLNRLVLNTAEDKKNAPKGAKQYSATNTSHWPRVTLSIDKLILNDLNIGRWNANLAPTKAGYRATNIKGKIAKTDISAELAWANQQSSVKSHIDVTAKGGDFGAVLKQFGQSRVLENKSGSVKANLSWPGNPWNLEQSKLNGRLEFALQNGRIIEAGTSASFLRIFGILNLNTVIKRLKLDFSDLLEKGLAFDNVTAKYYLQNGVATSEAPLKLEGGAASIEMKGSINFVDKTLQNRMQVAIPLTSNAPVAALFLATPQVAGIAFIVDKLIGKKLAKLTALQYDISGSWFEPKIKPVIAKGNSSAPANEN